MATLLEIKSLFDDSDLQEKVEAALMIATQEVIDGVTPTNTQIIYAGQVFASPRTESLKAVKYVLAANNALTVAQIQGASDAAIRSNVAAVYDSLATAFVGV